jgi:hypothetical protein
MAWFSRTSDLLQRPDVKGQLQLLQRLRGKVESAASTKKLLSEHPSCLSVNGEAPQQQQYCCTG